MSKLSVSQFLSSYWKDLFNLKQHLQEFLHLDLKTLELNLKLGNEKLANLGYQNFQWENTESFYRDKIGELYLFDLGEWHLNSSDYIQDTLRLIVDHAQGKVLDFGGGIGTHTIAAALCPKVEQVIYCDINSINRDFVAYRVEQLGLNNKIIICERIPVEETFETIICFDVLEHLSDPSTQLLQFHEILKSDGKVIVNWCFFKGFNQEHPFHVDDPKIVDHFFKTIQSHFLEIFHPYYITARCYSKWTKY